MLLSAPQPPFQSCLQPSRQHCIATGPAPPPSAGWRCFSDLHITLTPSFASSSPLLFYFCSPVITHLRGFFLSLCSLSRLGFSPASPFTSLSSPLLYTWVYIIIPPLIYSLTDRCGADSRQLYAMLSVCYYLPVW